jgi:hypothetical protein
MEQAAAERIAESKQPGEVDLFVVNPVPLISNIRNPVILQRCIELLIELQMEIRSNGFDEGRDLLLLKRIYGEPSNLHLQPSLIDEYSIWFETATAPEEKREAEGYYTPEECTQRFLRETGKEINKLKKQQRQRDLIESKRMTVESLLQRVPDTSVLDRLLRSRNSLEREFYRLQAEYDRAQRIRKGQPLAPQLDVKIS